MIFKFRMLSDENDGFIREYEVPYDMNLLDFNDFICRDLKYESGVMASFFTSDTMWNKLDEFTIADMGEQESFAPRTMSSVSLGQIIHKNKDRLIYVFDILSDRAYYLELIEAKRQEEGVRYPRVTLSEAEPSDQFEAPTENDGSASIFDEVMEEFGDFGGYGSDDDYSDDEY